MSNFFTDVIAKIAGNVTQSVISAVLVFLITTYVLVGIGKKGGGGTAADSTKAVEPAKKEAVASPSGEREEKTSAPLRGSGASGSGKVKTPVMVAPSGGSPAGLPQGNAQREDAGLASEKTARKNNAAPPERSREVPVTVSEPAAQPADATLREPATLEKTTQESAVRHSKRDTIGVEKKAKEEVKKVKKRADEIFDELDQETGKNPEP